MIAKSPVPDVRRGIVDPQPPTDSPRRHHRIESTGQGSRHDLLLTEGQPPPRHKGLRRSRYRVPPLDANEVRTARIAAPDSVHPTHAEVQVLGRSAHPSRRTARQRRGPRRQPRAKAPRLRSDSGSKGPKPPGAPGRPFHACSRARAHGARKLAPENPARPGRNRRPPPDRLRGAPAGVDGFDEEKEQRRKGAEEIVRRGALPSSPFPLFPFSPLGASAPHPRASIPV